MKNLAGNERCDEWIAEELKGALIPSETCSRSPGEVPSRLVGRLGPITFRRAWTYWMAAGPIPIELARKLYADPVGAADVRVAGHCGCPPPEPPWTSLHGGAETVDSYHIDTEVGLRLFADTVRAMIETSPVTDAGKPCEFGGEA